jgi:hypothetical protein
MELLKRKDLQAAAKLFAKATKASRAHSKLTSESLDKYGDHGPQISGVIRDHFPKGVKDKLRTLAREVSKHSDAAYTARPKGVRLTTMRELSRAVATKTGHGFYGPTGDRKMRKKNPEHEIRELILWAENSPKLQNQFISIMKNLSRKYKKGIYDPVLAAKLWKYWVDEAVKDYNKEILGGGYSLRQNVFTVQDRKDAASELEALWVDDVRTGEYLRLSNPKGKKKMAKKRRTAKQRAATKKLIAFNKARKKKKTKTARRKTRRKKNVVRRGFPKTVAKKAKRTSLKKSHLWVLFRCVGNKIQFYNGGWPISKQWGPRGKAALFRTRGHASANAKSLQRKGPKSAVYGAAPENTTTAKIKDYCDYQSGK